jgi:hypothetical protein
VPPGEPPPAPNWTASPAPTATAAPSSPAGDAPDEYQSTPHSTPPRTPLGLETPPDSRPSRAFDHDGGDASGVGRPRSSWMRVTMNAS